MKTSHSIKLTAAAVIITSLLVSGCHQVNSSTAAIKAEAVVVILVEVVLTR